MNPDSKLSKVTPLSSTIAKNPSNNQPKPSSMKKLTSSLFNKGNLNEITIKLKKGSKEVNLPKYAHDGDAGMDVYAVDVKYLPEYDAYMYHTGLYIESPKNICCYLMPRSSNMKTDAYMPNSIGLVDTVSYRGEICFVFKNRTSIETRASILAMKNIGSMPWYKRMFASFEKEFDKCYMNLYDNPRYYAPYEIGDKMGQMMFITFPTVNIEEVDELSETTRGSGGFGSTGK